MSFHMRYNIQRFMLMSNAHFSFSSFPFASVALVRAAGIAFVYFNAYAAMHSSSLAPCINLFAFDSDARACCVSSVLSASRALAFDAMPFAWHTNKNEKRHTQNIYNPISALLSTKVYCIWWKLC